MAAILAFPADRQARNSVLYEVKSRDCGLGIPLSAAARLAIGARGPCCQNQTELAQSGFETVFTPCQAAVFSSQVSGVTSCTGRASLPGVLGSAWPLGPPRYINCFLLFSRRTIIL